MGDTERMRTRQPGFVLADLREKVKKRIKIISHDDKFKRRLLPEKKLFGANGILKYLSEKTMQLVLCEVKKQLKP